MSTLLQETEKQIQSWLDGPFDKETKDRILTLQKEDPSTLLNAFQTTLQFGTGGMRGIMDVGTNRINKYTVAFVTQAISNYLKTLPLPKKVAICYDTRLNSFAFAEEVAKVFLGNEIEVHLFKDPRPIALISLAVRELACTFGVMITASHNPPEYNGYKVYSPEGSQLLPPHDIKIVEETKKILHISQVKFGTLEDPKFHWITSSFDQTYLHKIHPLLFHQAQDKSRGKELKIIYTPLHGAGREIVPKAFDFFGFTNYELVQKQMSADGNFPTVKAPNPEEKSALALGIKQLEMSGDLLFATDADSDRLAVVVKHEKELIALTGNETGTIMAEYICSSYKQAKQFPPKSILITTIVTTKLINRIADFYGAHCLEVLTGFKYIGQKISQFEEEKKVGPSHHFLFGFEESYGYLLGTHVRDKDAVISAILLAEMALHLKISKKTLIDFLFEIYQKYGLVRDKLLSLTFPASDGLKKMQSLMQNLRTNLPQQIAGEAVLLIEDYQKGEKHDLLSGKKEPLFSPHSDVLRFFFKEGTLVIRPSGTEPKIKLYASIEDSHHIKDVAQMKARIDHLDKKAEALLQSFSRLIKNN